MQQAQTNAGLNWRLIRRLGLLLVAVLLVGAALEGWLAFKPYINRPLAQIEVHGDLSQHNQQMLEQQVAQYLDAGFMELDIRAIQAALMQLGWVEQAQINRIWPERLRIDVREHKPVARWGDEQLLNIQAHVFAREGMRNHAGLPQLYGPQDSQVQVMEQYWSLSQILRPLGYSIQRLELRERGSWFVTTNSGLQLLLGREEVMEKMRRFVTIYEKELKPQMEQIARIDLRYSNGLAVTWREAVTQTGN